MTISINYKNSAVKKNSTNLILFIDENFTISTLKKHLLSSDFSFIADLIKTKELKNKILSFDISSKKKIIIVSLKKNIKPNNIENLGAKFYDLYKDLKNSDYLLNSNTIPQQYKNVVGLFCMA